MINTTSGDGGSGRCPVCDRPELSTGQRLLAALVVFFLVAVTLSGGAALLAWLWRVILG